jgi:hypothetical protein
MHSIVPLDRLPVDETDIGFVDERRCLQAVPHALSRHAALRDPVELLMDERDQSLEGTLVAVSPLDQESGDLRVVMSNPRILGPFPLFDSLDESTLHSRDSGARCRKRIQVAVIGEEGELTGLSGGEIEQPEVLGFRARQVDIAFPRGDLLQ